MNRKGMISVAITNKRCRSKIFFAGMDCDGGVLLAVKLRLTECGEQFPQEY